MKNKLWVYILGIILLLLAPDIAAIVHAETVVFGPETYTRSKGKPQEIAKSFSIKGHEPYTLYVQNGDVKTNKVSSAVIEVNGIKILWPEDFDKQVDVIMAPVKLKGQNEIAVEVRGEPKTSIVVKIVGSTTPEILASVRPDYINVNESTTVAISALMELKSNLTPSSVALTQYDKTYKSAANLGSLYNDGTHGDRKAGDNQYTTQVVINESFPTMLHYRVSADYKDKEILKRVKSDFFDINVAKIPSVTETITPQGGTITLEGYASVTFPEGAFPSSTAVKVMVTSSPGTKEDFNMTADIANTGTILPYEIRINSSYVAPTTSIDAVFYVPDPFISSIPLNAKIEVFIQLLHVSEHEALDNFYYGFSSIFDPVTKTVRATLPEESFTNLRGTKGTYEAIIIVGTTLK